MEQAIASLPLSWLVLPMQYAPCLETLSLKCLEAQIWIACDRHAENKVVQMETLASPCEIVWVRKWLWWNPLAEPMPFSLTPPSLQHGKNYGLKAQSALA